MIEATLRQIIDSVSILKEMMGMKMPVRTAYKIARISKEVQNHVDSFTEIRNQLIEKYAERDKGGRIKQDENGNISLERDKIEDFNNTINNALQEQVTINSEQIDIEELMELNFSPNDMLLIEPFIKE